MWNFTPRLVVFDRFVLFVFCVFGRKSKLPKLPLSLEDWELFGVLTYVTFEFKYSPQKSYSLTERCAANICQAFPQVLLRVDDKRE
jgi:hypothetical protein